MKPLVNRSVTFGVILAGAILAYIGLRWSGLLEPIADEYGPYDKGPIPAVMIAVGIVMTIAGISRAVASWLKP